MKKLLLITLVLFSSIIARSQDCSRKVDEFTKEVSVETDFINIGYSEQMMKGSGFPVDNFLYAKFIILNGVYTMWFKSESPFIQTSHVGDNIYFKFSNDSVFKFANVGDDIATGTFGGGKCPKCYFYTLTTEIVFNDKSFYQYLINNRVVKIRVGSMDYTVSDKAYNKILSRGNCIVNSK